MSGMDGFAEILNDFRVVVEKGTATLFYRTEGQDLVFGTVTPDDPEPWKVNVETAAVMMVNTISQGMNGMQKVH